jgi:hypothetical protein
MLGDHSAALVVRGQLTPRIAISHQTPPKIGQLRDVVSLCALTRRPPGAASQRASGWESVASVANVCWLTRMRTAHQLARVRFALVDRGLCKSWPSSSISRP